MILTVTVDNRAISFALFSGDAEPAQATPVATACFAAHPARTADEYAGLLATALAHKVGAVRVKTAILASVVPSLTEVIKDAISQVSPDTVCLTVGAGLRSGLILRTDTPAELGADLVALAAGALALCKPPFLVLDSGAVTTLSAVSAGKNGAEFLGCAILPGPALCADALKVYAAQLPHVALSRPARAIGANTGDSIRAGVVLGHGAAVEGLACRLEQEMGECDLPLILTGESAQMLSFSRRRVTYDAHLAHRGLYRLAGLNANKSGKRG